MDLLSALKRNISSWNTGIRFVRPDGEDRRVEYRELYESALKVLGCLQSRGVRAGDEIVIWVEDNEPFLTIFWSCLMGGFVPVPLSSGLRRDQQAKFFSIWRRLRRPWLAGEEHELDKMRQLAAGHGDHAEFEAVSRRLLDISGIMRWENAGIETDPEGEDLAFIQFSSGSTGDPKGVCLSHNNLLSNIQDIISSLGIDDGDTLLSWMPLTHDMGMIGFHLTGVVKGIEQVSIPTAMFIRRPLLWIEQACKWHATVLYSPNFGLHYFIAALQRTGIAEADLSGIRVIVTGAEPISVSLCRKFVETLKPYGLRDSVMVPAYGLAEASVEVTAAPLYTRMSAYRLDRSKLNIGDSIRVVDGYARGAGEFADVGYPVSSCSVRICDNEDHPLEENVVGHIQIQGKNVTSGYYSDQDATKKAFTHDQWLRTGDLGFLRDGRLVVTGRVKDVIIINGRNYYPQDIERCLLEAGIGRPGELVACGTGDPDGLREQLLIFVVHRNDAVPFAPIEKSVRNALMHLTGLLADRVVPVKRIPKTTSGKVKYHLLVEQYRSSGLEHVVSPDPEFELRAGADQEFFAGLLTEVCRSLPGMEGVSQYADLFDAGLNSLLAMQLAGRIRWMTGRDVTVTTVADCRNIQSLAERIRLLPGSGIDEIRSVLQAPHYPLSPAQRRLWLLSQMHRESWAYNESMSYDLREQLDTDLVRRVLFSMTVRHEMLRTTFEETDGVPFQVVHPAEEWELEFRYIDCSGEADAGSSSQQALARIIMQPFDLKAGPLCRFVVIKMGDDRYRISFIMHHIITDNWSADLLFAEFCRMYDAGKLGIPDAFSAPKRRYIDYASWANERLFTVLFTEHRIYWQKEFEDLIPVADLPADRERPPVKSFRGDSIYVDLGPQLSAGVCKCSNDQRTSVFTFLLLASYALMTKYTGQDDMVIGVPVAGRDHPDTQPIAGFFVNVLPLRLHFNHDRSVRALLHQLREKCYEVYSHGEYPFDEIVKAIGIKRDLSRSPLFDVLVTYSEANASSDVTSVPAGIRPEKKRMGSLSSKYDLSLYFEQGPGTLSCMIEYAQDLFTRKRMERFGDHLVHLVNWLVQHQDSFLRDAEYLSSVEKEQILNGSNGPKTQTAGFTVTGLFRQQAEDHPAAIAIECEGRTLTYEQLNNRAERVAEILVSRFDAGRGGPIPVILDRSENLVVAILGVWKAGAAYVPVDPAFPPERVQFILKDVSARVCITNRRNRPACESLRQERDGSFQCLDIDEVDLAGEPAGHSASPVGGLAYIMYTSGSTGSPKGVMIEHPAMINILLHLQKMTDLAHTDRLLAVSAYTFDISIVELLLPLICGARVIIASQLQVMDGRMMTALFGSCRPTMMQATPALWELLVESGWQGHSALKIITCGETLSESLKTKLLQRCGSLWNMYGPTETTIFSSGKLINNERERVTIGRPVSNTRIYILDAYGSPVPVGVFGELYIAGEGLAKGYLGNAEMTREKFLHATQIGELCYRSGDRGRWLEDGTIELAGRLDSQIKIRGHRVETGEVENTIAGYPCIRSAAVVVREGGHYDRQLIAYVILAKEEPNWKERLRRYLLGKLPGYMIPGDLIALTSFPLTINGKIDKRSLTGPGMTSQSPPKDEFKLPGTPTEKRLLELWQLVLGKEDISITEDFFSAGGHSLSGNRLVNRICKEWEIEMHLPDLFRHPTIERQSVWIMSREENSHIILELD